MDAAARWATLTGFLGFGLGVFWGPSIPGWIADTESGRKRFEQRVLGRVDAESPGDIMAVLLAKFHLSRLGYEPGPLDHISDRRFKEAVATYRDARGLPPGDSIDESFVTEMEKDTDELTVRPSVALRTGSDDYWEDGYVKLTGTWDNPSQPGRSLWQTAEIKCYRSERICLVADAVQSESGMLFAYANWMRIASWGKDTITTKPTIEDCAPRVLLISRDTDGEVSAMMRAEPNPNCTVEFLRPQMRLVDGNEQIRVAKESRGDPMRLYRMSPRWEGYLSEKKASKTAQDRILVK